jgi:PAS domain S-box-containing protein
MKSHTLNKIISISELWQFFNRSSTLFCITGPDGYMKQVNPYVASLLGYPEEVLLSSPYINFVHEGDRQATVEQSVKVRNHRPALQFRNRLVTATGETKVISWTATFIAAEENVYLIGQDLTETFNIEEKLKAERAEKQKAILEASILAQEKERTEIGKELHDNINQMLATAILFQQMALSGEFPVEEMVKKSGRILEDAIQEIRKLSKSLVGPDMRDAGLVDSVRELVQNISQGTGIEASVSCGKAVETLPDKLKLTLFRIVQEQCNNIVKHANANKLTIKIKMSSKNLSLTISDDGKGFDVKKKRNGIGINNMLSRIEIYNGKLILNSAIGKGCTLEVNIPITEGTIPASL